MTIISLEKQKRLNKLEELKKKSNYLMNLKQIRNSETNFENSSSASKDTYMENALKQVRQSDVTFNHDYTNMTGSGLLNPKTKPTKKSNKKINNLEDLIKKVEKEKDDLERNLKHQDSKEEPKLKYKEIKSPNKIKEEITWQKICEQVGKTPKKPEYFFARLRESHTIGSKTKLLNLKRSRLYE